MWNETQSVHHRRNKTISARSARRYASMREKQKRINSNNFFWFRNNFGNSSRSWTSNSRKTSSAEVNWQCHENWVWFWKEAMPDRDSAVDAMSYISTETRTLLWINFDNILISTRHHPLLQSIQLDSLLCTDLTLAFSGEWRNEIRMRVHSEHNWWHQRRKRVSSSSFSTIMRKFSSSALSPRSRVFHNVKFPLSTHNFISFENLLNSQHTLSWMWRAHIWSDLHHSLIPFLFLSRWRVSSANNEK